MAPSENDDASAPDTGTAGAAEPEEVSIGPGVSPHAPAAVPPPSAPDDRGDDGATATREPRRARPKPANSESFDEPVDVEAPDVNPPEPRQLVSGDPLLTGPTPVVKRGSSRPRDRATDDDRRARPSAPPSAAAPTTRPGSGQPVDAPGNPPTERDPRDLFEPVDTDWGAIRQRADAPPGPPTVPPPPAPGRAGSTRNGPDAPPPPPAPSFTGHGVPPGGGARPVTPGVAASSARPARRAARGAQVTGRQATAPSTTRPADPSGPVATLRPTTVAPVPRMAGRRPRVRRVTRVVRHVDPWSVFKVAAVFSFVAYGIALVAGVLLWNVAYATGTIDNIERGMESTGWETFELRGGEIFHNGWIGGLFVAVGLTGLAVLTATLFNLITDLVGGVRFTVLEEEVVEKSASPMRRFATRRPQGGAAADPSGPVRR